MAAQSRLIAAGATTTTDSKNPRCDAQLKLLDAYKTCNTAKEACEAANTALLAANPRARTQNCATIATVKTVCDPY